MFADTVYTIHTQEDFFSLSPQKSFSEFKIKQLIYCNKCRKYNKTFFCAWMTVVCADVWRKLAVCVIWGGQVPPAASHPDLPPSPQTVTSKWLCHHHHLQALPHYNYGK